MGSRLLNRHFRRAVHSDEWQDWEDAPLGLHTGCQGCSAGFALLWVVYACWGNLPGSMVGKAWRRATQDLPLKNLGDLKPIPKVW